MNRCARALAALLLMGAAGASRSDDKPLLIELPPEALAVDVGANGFVTSSDFCDPFGFCQGLFQQFEFTGGVLFRF